MIFTQTKLKDAFILDIEKKEDERGFFARTYCKNEFGENGISFTPVQANISYNRLNHTLRGMHYQVSPYEEAKLVSCVNGGIYDVIIDMRPDSPTCDQWIGVELTAENHRMLYIPEGFAHGFITLKRETQVIYMMSEFYTPGSGAGLKWNDPYYNIIWPEKPEVISEKDKNWPFI